MTERPRGKRRPARARTDAKAGRARAIGAGKKKAEAGHRLVADVMLAKVARWLRLAGIEIEDAPAGDDTGVLRRAKRTHATLLTSDVELFAMAKKHGVQALLIDQKDLDGQLAYAVRSLGLRVESEPENALCSVCGSRLRVVGKETAMRHGIDSNIADRYDKFYLCGGCGKVYWRGTHWQRIVDRLERIKRLAAMQQKDG